ncbi:ribokinase [Methylomarinum sp. Ch1-1]|uniref:Ribokinase n=1 Tax=Methylomarinum roseum TaxID=3067653 RepID=A0AAU7NZR3_9GAMM|nr:ribokinase [Methylomarinum sp. Ch1-1]MDP4521852.1 ribokinase [Methylomarinum sp. Ch1-1]
MNKAIVVGSINMDIVAFVQDHPKTGETIFGREVKYFPGGKGSNQAVSCKRLGSETLMIGRLGDDAFGGQLLAFQQQQGIDISGVRQLENTATGAAFITVADSADNSIVVVPGANALWDDGFIDELTIEQGDIVLAQFEIPDTVIEKTFNKAKAVGAMTILNPTPVRTINADIRNSTDLIVVNEHELAALSGREIDVHKDDTIFNGAARLHQEDYGTIIVTLGDKGARLVQAGQKHAIAARPVSAVDTTGAGDTFIGGIAAGLLSGLDLIRACELANIAASISVTREGAAASIPSLDEVNKLLRKRGHM